LEKSVEKYREKYQKAREAKQRLQEVSTTILYAIQDLRKGLRDEQEKNINSLMDGKDAPSQCQACDGIVSGSGTTVCLLTDGLSAFLLIPQFVRSVNPATCSTKGLALSRDI